MNPHHRRSRRVLRHVPRTLLVLVVAVATGGCAYFNTFYNARKVFEEAERLPRNPDGTANRNAAAQYDIVVEKCEKLVLEYPKSKWVDDAILMMGKCQYNKGEYDEAILRFEELQQNFPKSRLNEEGQLYLARCHLAKEQTLPALTVLRGMHETWPESKYADEVLFLLGTNSIKAGNEEDARTFLEILARDHSDSPYRIEADLSIAEIYAEAGDYERALEIYENLEDLGLKGESLVRYSLGRAQVHIEMDQYREAVSTTGKLGRTVLDDESRATRMLLEGLAYTGLDSLSRALRLYRSVTASYPRSKFSAEAAFRAGLIYQEKLDSLTVAKSQFEEVPRQYANSPFAVEAIRRSVSISKLQQLEASIETGGGESDEEKAAVQFDLAETHLLQFNDHELALTEYQAILDKYPTSMVAPKAAYAIAYIYDTVLEDEGRARDAYQLVIDRYPDSQQAEYARSALEKSDKSRAAVE